MPHNTAHRPPLILASGSSARASMLRACDLPFTITPATINESALKSHLRAQNLTPDALALHLARAKALDVSTQNLGSLVIGSDQILSCEGSILSKAKDKVDALEKLKILRGKTHTLHAAVSVFQNATMVFEAHTQASLTMHNLSDDDLHNYLDAAGDSITGCVGAYAIESHGAWLFARIEGDNFTIMGMPLLPLLGFLRAQGYGP